MTEYKGTDAVYNLDEKLLIQCFCADNGDGIQTNWWQDPPLTEDEIQILKNQGWIYVPDGSLWGLENKPYLTYSKKYLCGSPTPPIGGNILGISNIGKILGLAFTGGKVLLLGSATVGLLFLLLGFILKKNVKK